jgi:HAD superfamily hydrolase (TIGR01490 family)
VPADVLALFDLDHTLVALDSDYAWVEHLIARRALDGENFGRSNRLMAERYRSGEVGMLEFAGFYASTLGAQPLARLEAWRDDYLQTRIVPAIPARGRALVRRHRDAGDLCVLTTATSRFLSEPIARELGFEHVIATELEMRDGRFTGRVAGTPNMRECKIERLEAWLGQRRQHLADFRESWFYSDSQNDLPLLSHVTHPVAVNPDPFLATFAAEKRWPVLQIG